VGMVGASIGAGTAPAAVSPGRAHVGGSLRVKEALVRTGAEAPGEEYRLYLLAHTRRDVRPYETFEHEGRFRSTPAKGIR